MRTNAQCKRSGLQTKKMQHESVKSRLLLALQDQGGESADHAGVSSGKGLCAFACRFTASLSRQRLDVTNTLTCLPLRSLPIEIRPKPAEQYIQPRKAVQVCEGFCASHFNNHHLKSSHPTIWCHVMWHLKLCAKVECVYFK